MQNVCGAQWMTHVETESSQKSDPKNLLRDVLHIVAASTEPAQGIPPLLDFAHALTDARSTLFFLFAEPQVMLHTGALVEAPQLRPEDVLTLTRTLSPGQHHDLVLPGDLRLDSAYPLFAAVNGQEQPVGLLGLLYDHALRPEAAALEAVLDGLTILAQQVCTTARHEKITRNQNEFLRIVLHDLRSPLTSMKGFASMLESGTVGEINSQQSHFVSKILSGISQMTMLVENVQDAGRYDPETGFYEMHRAPCDVVEIARKIVNNHLVPAEKQELSIALTAANDLPIVNADATMIERAIINLVDNAIKYTPNGGRVEVSVRREQDNLVLAVSDTGLGISPENQKQLFERHFRVLRNEHKRIKGSGLGLFIVRSVAQRHGGRAWVESAEGKGSTFLFSIPLHSDGAAP